MNRCIYAFELRGIQSYLFNTGRLKDMIEASELIDYICNAPLDKALNIAEVDPQARHPRRAGGAAYLSVDSKEQAQRLRDIWNLLVRQLLPGIELVDAVAEGESIQGAVKAAIDQLQTARNQPVPELPIATPLTALAPRTGQAGVTREGSETLDHSTDTRRKIALSKNPPDSRLLQRFSEKKLQWPNNFESNSTEQLRFPLNKDNLVGMLHLDGNGIGQLLRKLNEAASGLDDDKYIEAYQLFSKELQNITETAAKKATEEVLIPKQNEHGVMPARPLVLGGDDLSLLIRPDLAIPYAEAFVKEYEALSSGFLKELEKKLGTNGLPQKLTASGGLALVKSGFPFSQAFALSESLCEIAKTQGTDAEGNKCSALSMHQVQGAIGDDAVALFEREKCVHARGQFTAVELALRAYALSEGDALPDITTLQDAANAFQKSGLSKGRLRKLLDLMHQNLGLAETDYQRWQELNKNNEEFKAFQKHIIELSGPLEVNLPISQEPNSYGRQQTPLMDVLMLLDITMASSEHTDRNNDRGDN